jgi:hypothetical protein
LTVAALTDCLPLDVTRDVKTGRHDTLKLAERCEAEWGEEQGSFLEGSLRNWGHVPLPDGPSTVGIAGGAGRDGEAKQHNCEVIVGTRTLAFTRDEDEETPSSQRCGCVQTVATTSKRRLSGVWQAPGVPLNQPMPWLSDGGDTVRARPLSLRPDAEPIVDGFHLTMRLTVWDQDAKGLGRCEQVLGEEMRPKIERLQWALWHGHVDKALGKSDALALLIDNFDETSPKCTQLAKAGEECRTSIEHNGHLIPHDGERYRHGEAIATGFVESTVHHVLSKRFGQQQQRPWSKRGAQLLLQTRVKTLNRALGSVFKRCYPDIDIEELDEAA